MNHLNEKQLRLRIGSSFLGLTFFTVVILMLSFSSCKSRKSQKSEFTEIQTASFNLYMGEMRFVNSEATAWIQFDSVISDSRCPQDVNCFWEGNASIQAQLRLNNQSHQLVLHTYSEYANDTLVDKLKVSLVGVHPYPTSTTIINKGDYRITLKVENP